VRIAVSPSKSSCIDLLTPHYHALYHCFVAKGSQDRPNAYQCTRRSYDVRSGSRGVLRNGARDICNEVIGRVSLGVVNMRSPCIVV
jgi:hypothetical protein